MWPTVYLDRYAVGFLLGRDGLISRHGLVRIYDRMRERRLLHWLHSRSGEALPPASGREGRALYPHGQTAAHRGDAALWLEERSFEIGSGAEEAAAGSEGDLGQAACPWRTTPAKVSGMRWSSASILRNVTAQKSESRQCLHSFDPAYRADVARIRCGASAPAAKPLILGRLYTGRMTDLIRALFWGWAPPNPGGRSWLKAVVLRGMRIPLILCRLLPVSCIILFRRRQPTRSEPFWLLSV